MTQYGYDPLSPDDSGSTLLERVNGVVPALLTNHKGAARPGYVQPGMMWIDDSGASWLLNLYDGQSDINIAAINPVDHTVTLAGHVSNTLTPYSFIADKGQTAFDLGMSPSANACIFSQNGAWLTGGGVDYAIAGSTLTLTMPAVAGDRISGVAIASFEVANALLPAANLADLADIAVARNNLGLKSAATRMAGDPSLLPSGSVVGRAYAEYLSTGGHTVVLPLDSTVPQVTEGDEILSAAYTPKLPGSSLRITFSGTALSSAQNWVTAAIFLNGGTSAVKSVADLVPAANNSVNLNTVFEVAPSGATEQIISVRVGPHTASTVAMNEAGGGATLGGTLKTILLIEEIAP